MEKRRNRLDHAKSYFEKALEYSPNDGAILSGLGDIARRQGDFEGADRLYRHAINYPPSDARSRRHEIIIRTAIADNLRRWTEELVKNKQYEIALKKAQEAYSEANRAVQLQGSDDRSRDTLQETAFQLGKILAETHNFDTAQPYFKQAITDRPRRIRTKRVTVWACYYLAENLIESGRRNEAENILRKGRRLILPRWKSISEHYDLLLHELKRPTGILSSVNREKGYGFIDTKEGTIFVHISQITPQISNEEFKQYQGSQVFFDVIQTDKGPQAENVKLVKTGS
jgi:CspA family cold shock protein